MIHSKKCSICHKNKATTYRNINGREYFICDNKRCNFLTLLRNNLLKKRNLDYLEILKDKEEIKNG
jgi:hypothetical protein